MSVTSTTVQAVGHGNGATLDFGFAFKIFAETDIVVWKETAAGVYTLQAITTNYTVVFDTAAETGTVSYVAGQAPGNGLHTVTARATAQTQASSFPREAPMPEQAIENALDKLTLMAQEYEERWARAPLQPLVPAAPAGIIIEAPVNAKGLRWAYDAGAGKWYIESTTFDPDDVVKEAQASAAAALASQVAAAASEAEAQALVDTLTYVYSGVYADRPAAPVKVTWYYSTDRGQMEIYVPVAAKWFLLG